MTDEIPPSQLTQAAYDRLKTELDELQSTGRKEIAERLQRARELGDLSENAEYHETKNQQGMMEARIRKIEATLRDAIIVEAPTSASSAQAGTFVTLRPLDGSEEETYLLASSKEERSSAARTVTTVSPLGQVLVGRVTGDTVDYQAPGGKFSYEILKIEPWDGSS